MAVTWARKIWEGREGGGDLDGNLTHMQLYRVKTDDKNDDQTVVLQAQALPFVGQVHPNDPASYCNSIRARNEGASPYFWTVTASYSNEREASDDPLDDPVEYEWATEQFQRVADKDRNGNAIVNSAGEPFDPPIMMDDSRRVVTMTVNLAVVPTWILSYKDAINSDEIIIDGVSIGVGVAKCQRVTVSKQKKRNDVEFRTVTLVIHFDPDGWDYDQLDSGFHELDANGYLIQITNEGDGSVPTTPVLLDGQGEAIEDPTPESAVFLTFELYNQQAFQSLPGIDPPAT